MIRYQVTTPEGVRRVVWADSVDVVDGALLFRRGEDVGGLFTETHTILASGRWAEVDVEDEGEEQ